MIVTAIVLVLQKCVLFFCLSADDKWIDLGKTPGFFSNISNNGISNKFCLDCLLELVVAVRRIRNWSMYSRMNQVKFVEDIL